MKAGDRVVWQGQEGVVQQLMFSRATERELAVVAFDSRIRLTVRTDELIPLKEPA